MDSSGTQLWAQFVHGQKESTDIAVSTDETYFIISGHGSSGHQCNGGLDGRFSRLAMADGSIAWTTGCHGDNRSLIYDECWGISFVDDAQGPGALAFCGTGIESGTCPAKDTTPGRCNTHKRRESSTNDHRVHVHHIYPSRPPHPRPRPPHLPFTSTTSNLHVHHI